MAVTESRYKDVFAVEVKTAKLTAKFLPLCGGRFVSLIDNETGTQLLAQDENPHYIPESQESDYCSCNVSAFDDMFPTIDPSAPAKGCREGVRYDDHGEVCRYPHQYKVTNDKLEMKYVSDRLHYVWTKTVSVDGDKLVINYNIENTSDDEFPYIWAGHCMFNAFVGAEVISPFAENASIEVMFDNEAEYGKRGDIRPACREMLVSREYTKEKNNAYKFYYSDKLSKGEIGYKIPSIGKTVKMSFDEKKIPYLGVWMNNGNFKDMFSAAVEPCTAAFDFVENANKHGQSSVIAPRSSVNFSLIFSI